MNNLKNLSIISGIGGGKTTISSHLVKKLGYTKFSVADEVKMIAKMILGRDLDKGTDRTLLQQIGQYLKVPAGKLTKEMWEKIDDWILDDGDFAEYYIDNAEEIFNPNFYINKLFEKEEFKSLFKDGNTVIDDMRFINEADKFRNKGRNEYDFTSSRIIKIDVPEEIRIKRILARDKTFNPEWLKDSSEAEWDLIQPDAVISNCDLKNDPELGYRNLDEIIEEILKV